MLLEFSSKRILNSAVTSGGKELYHIHTQTHFGMARTLTVIRRSGDDKSVAVIEWKEHQISIAAGGNVTKASLAQLHSMQSTHAGEITRHWQLNGKYYHIEYVVPENEFGVQEEHSAYWEATPSDDDNGAAWFLPPQTNILGKLKRVAQFEMNEEVDDWGDRLFLLVLFIYSQTRLTDSRSSKQILRN